MSFPALLSVEDVHTRLNSIFPETFPDRGILVGIMAARTVFICLYGNFIEGSGTYFRPSMVTGFTQKQAEHKSQEDRAYWTANSGKQKFITPGKTWYEKGTREPIRDDLIRNRLIPVGIVKRLEGYAPTHPAPIYYLDASFAALFDPALIGEALEAAIVAWREERLDAMTLRRMALSVSGVKAREGQVEVTLPTSGKTLRLAAGEASVITKDVCEVFAPSYMKEPVVVHISLSDQKTFPELVGVAKSIGLTFDPKAELPDVVIADIGRKQLAIAFIEVVHSDGPITELRKKALLSIARDAGITPEHVGLVTAFESRNSPAFKKRVSELASDSMVWFRSEPSYLLTFLTMHKPV